MIKNKLFTLLFLGSFCFLHSLFAQNNVLSIYGDITLIDEVDVSKTSHDFEELPKGASSLETIFGKVHRVIKNDKDKAARFSYVLGKGKGLKAADPYVLVVDFPEDASRAFVIHYTGSETRRGIATGQASPDVLFPKYIVNNNESLKYPLSGKTEVWSNLFFMNNKFAKLAIPRGREAIHPTNEVPENGFRVVIARPAKKHQPISKGAAISRIRLFKVNNEAAIKAKLVLPPKELPQRYIFWREEMSDNVLGKGVEASQWYEYKMRLMAFLGINTFSKDLLEFGHNQGWDSNKYGWKWLNANKDPSRWKRILDKAAKHNLTVFPYYEYCGSIGPKSLGVEKRCKTLTGKKTYTHITWSEKGNADITDPDTVADLKKVLELTIVRHKDKVNFLGAWLRPRNSGIPISFSDRCLGLFAKEANNGKATSRDELKTNKALYGKYLKWWYKKRADFVNTIQQWLAKELGKDAYVLFTTDAAESGKGVGNFVTDDPEIWKGKLGKTKVVDVDDVVKNNMHYKALVSPRFNWGGWEWHHSIPHADPWNYKNSKFTGMSYTYHRMYSVLSEEAFKPYKNPMGLAMVRHHSLNENNFDMILGYLCVDVEMAGPYSMMTEAVAVAKGDPRFLGILSGHNYNRGFPYYVRQFNSNFLALPALDSTIIRNAASDKKVYLREIKTAKHGTYYALVNTGFKGVKNVTIKLPAKGTATAIIAGKTLERKDGAIIVSLYPGQLLAIHVK